MNNQYSLNIVKNTSDRVDITSDINKESVCRCKKIIGGTIVMTLALISFNLSITNTSKNYKYNAIQDINEDSLRDFNYGNSELYKNINRHNLNYLGVHDGINKSNLSYTIVDLSSQKKVRGVNNMEYTAREYSDSNIVKRNRNIAILDDPNVYDDYIEVPRKNRKVIDNVVIVKKKRDLNISWEA